MCTLKKSSQGRQRSASDWFLVKGAMYMLLQLPKPYHDRWWTGEGALKLYARDYPAKAGLARLPVICLHGLTRNSADFTEIASHIAAQGRRVIVPDMRGRGLSDNDPDPLNYH